MGGGTTRTPRMQIPLSGRDAQLPARQLRRLLLGDIAPPYRRRDPALFLAPTGRRPPKHALCRRRRPQPGSRCGGGCAHAGMDAGHEQGALSDRVSHKRRLRAPNPRSESRRLRCRAGSGVTLRFTAATVVTLSGSSGVTFSGSWSMSGTFDGSARTAQNGGDLKSSVAYCAALAAISRRYASFVSSASPTKPGLHQGDITADLPPKSSGGARKL